MDNNIYIQYKSSKYQINQKTGLVHCKTIIKLNIFGEIKIFHGEGYSHCTKENIFNESFGKALACIRARQDVDRQIETSLVKYSFDHFVRDEVLVKSDVIIKEMNEILKRHFNIREKYGPPMG